MTRDFALWIAELSEPEAPEPTHFKQTGSTTACGVNLHQYTALFSVDLAKVDCDHCINLKIRVSKIGHPTEGTE